MDAKTWDRSDRLWEMWPVLTAPRRHDAVARRRRKFRLMAAALCRDVWGYLEDARSRDAVAAAERFADGEIGAAELEKHRRKAWDAYGRGDGPRGEAAARTGLRLIDYALADHAAAWVGHRDALKAAERAAGSVGWVRHSAADKAKVWRTSDLIREAFGNPFLDVTFDPAWRTADVVALVEAAYAERLMPAGRLDAVRLCVLADALEEAGCATEVLAHLRSPGPHVRGCWALDLARA